MRMKLPFILSFFSNLGGGQIQEKTIFFEKHFAIKIKGCKFANSKLMG